MAMLLFGTVAGAGMAQPATAQVDRASCGWFETQEDAQDAFDAGSLPAIVADGDGDGIACEELPSGGARDRASCGWYETQEDAQARFDMGGLDPVVFDPDGDGVACEDLPGEAQGETLPVVSLPATGDGHDAAERRGIAATAASLLGLGSAALAAAITVRRRVSR